MDSEDMELPRKAIDAVEDSASPKKRKRNRVPISCTICRRRKVKCDKGKPTCVNCKKNGVQNLCVYMQPSWAKDLDEDELKCKTYTVKKEKDSGSDQSDTDSINKDEEIQRLRQRVQELENSLMLQSRQVDSLPAASTTTPSTAMTTPRGCTSYSQKIANNNQDNHRRVPAIANNPYTIGLAEIDLVKNFNILYTSKRNAKNQFPIIYQISMMSWLFIIKNDSYLNDLWIKIFNLRKYYEQQYVVTDGTESTKKILELSKQTNNFISNIKSSSGSFASTNKDEELDFNNFNFTTNQPNPAECPVTKQSGECPVSHTYQPPVPLKRPAPSETVQEKCPVTGSAGECPVQHPAGEEKKKKFAKFKKLPQSNTPSQTVLQCPMIRHNGGLKQLASENKYRMIAPDLAKLAEDDDAEDSKVCPLMIGDGKSIFRERLQNISSTANNTNLNGGKNECPVIGCDSNPAKRRKAASKRVKSIATPTDIKSMDFSNPKEVMSVFEKHLPPKKVIWLLVKRFFDKLYLHLPIIDEYSFRERTAKIIGSEDCPTRQRIKLTHLGTDYNEDFLTLCLLVIILRLSWLTLPSNLPKKFSQTEENSHELTADEKVMIKPEHAIPMVLIDVIKEIFTDVRILSTPSVVILQVGMFLKYYNVLAPEDGFELDDSYNGSSHSNGVSPDKEALNLNSSVFFNSLISLAKTIGLNRDPVNFKNFQTTETDETVNVHLARRRHLWRKMWYFLINMNVLTNISLGDYSKHLNIEIDDTGSECEHGNFSEYWDTRRPSSIDLETLKKCFPDFNGKTDNNYQRELKVIQLIDLEYNINILIYKGMKVLLNVKTLPLKSEVDQIIDQLTALVHDEAEGGGTKFKSGSTTAELLVRYDRTRETELSASARIFEFKLFLIIKMLMFVLNYIMFLNYELKLKELLSENRLDARKMVEDPTYLDDVDPQLVEAIEYNKQLYDQHFEKTLLLAIDNYNIFVQFFDNSNKFFPNLGGELLIYPFLMILNHRSKQFLISLVLRLQQNDPVISQILVMNGINKDELLNKLFGYLKIFLGKLDKLTKHYYYAWRLKKLMKFFYNVLISSSKLFTSNYTKMLAKNGDSAEQCPVLQDIKTSSIPVLANQRQLAVIEKEKERISLAKVQATNARLQQAEAVARAQAAAQRQDVAFKQEPISPSVSSAINGFQQPAHAQTIPMAQKQFHSQASPDMSQQLSINGLQLDDNTNVNGNNTLSSNDKVMMNGNMNSHEFGQTPSEFANHILNGISDEVQNGAFNDNQQLDLFDELMLNNFPVADRSLFASSSNPQAQVFDYFADDTFSNNELGGHHSYGVNEIDFTNVDLNTLPVYQMQQQPGEHDAGENGTAVPNPSSQDGNGARQHPNNWFQSFH